MPWVEGPQKWYLIPAMYTQQKKNLYILCVLSLGTWCSLVSLTASGRHVLARFPISTLDFNSILYLRESGWHHFSNSNYQKTLWSYCSPDLSSVSWTYPFLSQADIFVCSGYCLKCSLSLLPSLSLYFLPSHLFPFFLPSLILSFCCIPIFISYCSFIFWNT